MGFAILAGPFYLGGSWFLLRDIASDDWYRAAEFLVLAVAAVAQTGVVVFAVVSQRNEQRTRRAARLFPLVVEAAESIGELEQIVTNYGQQTLILLYRIAKAGGLRNASQVVRDFTDNYGPVYARAQLAVRSLEVYGDRSGKVANDAFHAVRIHPSIHRIMIALAARQPIDVSKELSALKSLPAPPKALDSSASREGVAVLRERASEIARDL